MPVTNACSAVQLKAAVDETPALLVLTCATEEPDYLQEFVANFPQVALSKESECEAGLYPDPAPAAYIFIKGTRYLLVAGAACTRDGIKKAFDDGKTPDGTSYKEAGLEAMGGDAGRDRP